MRPEELLPTIAEIAVTLATLSGVAGVIGPRQSGSEPSRILLRDVAVIGLVAALFSLLPLLLEDRWRLLSILAGLVWLTGFLHSARQMQFYRGAERRVVWTGPLVTLVGLTLFGWNALFPDADSPLRYTGGVLCQLGIAGLAFVYVVFASAE
jgi:hypothetical protein